MIMNKLLFIISLFFISFCSQAEEKTWDQELTPEQRESYSKFMDLPEPAEESPEPNALESKPLAPTVPTIQGSRSIADEAYRNKDYETAYQHYKALAKEGDGEASVIVGTMHEEGLGTEKDQAAARAWYKKAGDTNADDGAGRQLAEALESGSMTAEDIAKSEEIYNNLQSISQPESYTNDQSSYNFRLTNTSSPYRTAVQRQSTKVQNTFELSNQVKITPEKYLPEENNQLTKYPNPEHYKPKKYTR